MRDERLVGRWRLDSGVRHPEYLEEMTVEFSADGALVYRYLHDGEPTSISLSYDADGSVLTTRGSVSGKEGKTRYHFTADGNLVYDDGARYRRLEEKKA
jgi:hypothetical protein